MNLVNRKYTHQWLLGTLRAWWFFRLIVQICDPRSRKPRCLPTMGPPVEVIAPPLVACGEGAELAPGDRQPGLPGEPPNGARQLAVIVAAAQEPRRCFGHQGRVAARGRNARKPRLRRLRARRRRGAEDRHEGDPSYFLTRRQPGGWDRSLPGKDAAHQAYGHHLILACSRSRPQARMPP